MDLIRLWWAVMLFLSGLLLLYTAVIVPIQVITGSSKGGGDCVGKTRGLGRRWFE